MARRISVIHEFVTKYDWSVNYMKFPGQWLHTDKFIFEHHEQALRSIIRKEHVEHDILIWGLEELHDICLLAYTL